MRPVKRLFDPAKGVTAHRLETTMPAGLEVLVFFTFMFQNLACCHWCNDKLQTRVTARSPNHRNLYPYQLCLIPSSKFSPLPFF